MSEDTRRILTAVLAWGSWFTAIALVSALTYFNLTNPLPNLPNTFQRLAGLFVILFMGTGIAAGTALSRMKLGTTIVKALEEGYRMGKEKRN